MSLNQRIYGSAWGFRMDDESMQEEPVLPSRCSNHRWPRTVLDFSETCANNKPKSGYFVFFPLPSRWNNSCPAGGARGHGHQIWINIIPESNQDQCSCTWQRVPTITYGILNCNIRDFTVDIKLTNKGGLWNTSKQHYWWRDSYPALVSAECRAVGDATPWSSANHQAKNRIYCFFKQKEENVR